MRRIACLMLVVVAGCDSPQRADDGDLRLSPTQRLIRASMVLRGIRPSLAELAEVDRDPEAFAAIVDRYLVSPELGTTIREMHDEALLVRIASGEHTLPAIGPLTGHTFLETAASMYSEPLRLIEDIVMSDAPYTQIVTADYTMADPIVATMWGMQHSGAPGWERTHYPDGRGAVGILGSSPFYVRWQSTGINYNRGRAARFANALLCHDFAAADIAIDTSVDLADPDAVGRAVTTNASCVGCHQTLDPLASYFFPFVQGVYVASANPAYPVTNVYTAGDANNWFGTNYRPPGYFGHAAEGLAGLGRAIAEDPRFAQCTVKRFASYVTETPIASLDRAWIARLQTEFVDSGFNARKLLRAIILSDEVALAASNDPAMAANLVGYAKVRPQQLARMMHDLTGYRWISRSNEPYGTYTRVGDVEYLDDDFLGFRVLMGGIDSFFVTSPVHTMNATSSLVLHELARRSAEFVVERDAVVPAAERTLFVVDPASADDADVRAQLAHLHARLYGMLYDTDLDDALALHRDALAASGDPQRAWVVTLTAMFSDPRMVYY